MKYILLCVTMLFCVVACQNSATEQAQPPVTVTEEQFIEYNKAMFAEENEHIDAFLLRYQWQVATTETGVRYQIYKTGDGVKIEPDDILQCAYTLKLITGDEIYNSDNDGKLIFRIGKSNQPAGLEDVLLLLRQGDRAKIIVPSYLAYGLAGDDNKIPSAATLIYDIYIEKVIQEQEIK
jgi:FKBP-type peptidyl-prolyl cis-trans isomerase